MIDIAFFAASSGGARLLDGASFFELSQPTAYGQTQTKTVWVENLGDETTPSGAQVFVRQPVAVPPPPGTPDAQRELWWRGNLHSNFIDNGSFEFSFDAGLTWLPQRAYLPALVPGALRTELRVRFTSPRFDLRPEIGSGSSDYDYTFAGVHADFLPFSFALGTAVGCRVVKVDSFDDWGQFNDPKEAFSWWKWFNVWATQTAPHVHLDLTQAGVGRRGTRALYIDGEMYSGVHGTYLNGVDAHGTFLMEGWGALPAVGMLVGFALRLGTEGVWTDPYVQLVNLISTRFSSPRSYFILSTGLHGRLRVFSFVYGVGYTLLGETAPIDTDTEIYHYVEFGAENGQDPGRCMLRVDGATLIDASVIGSATAASNIGVVGLGAYGYASWDAPGPAPANMSVEIYMDDLYVAETAGPLDTAFLGDVQVRALRPTSSGELSEFPDVAPPLVQRYDAVNDEVVPDYETSYVGVLPGSFVDYPRELFRFQGAPGRVLAVQALALGGQAVSPPLSAEEDAYRPFMLGDGSSLFLSHEVQASLFEQSREGWAYGAQCWAYNPLTGLPWSTAQYNALRAGVMLANQGTTFRYYLTKMLLEVLMVPSTVVSVAANIQAMFIN